MSAVTPATVAELPAACRRLFRTESDSPASDRFLGFIQAGEVDPAGIFITKSGPTLTGAIYGYPMGGGQATLWPPVAETPALDDALTAHALAWLHAGGAKVVQAVVRLPERATVRPLERAGFQSTSILVFLLREIVPADGEPGPFRVRFEPQDPPSALFADTLVETYIDSLDCPELNDTRTAAETVAGYLATAGCDPPLWWLIRGSDRPAGVLMLTPKDDDGINMDLTYLGLVPDARRRTLGAEVLRFALAVGSRLGTTMMTLSVDDRNIPALRMYAANGFREFDRRAVYLRIF